jgi:hypothetical protein
MATISSKLLRALADPSWALSRLKLRVLSGDWAKDWQTRDWAAPSPHFIKRACLLRNGIPNATWVETGTFMGETTRFLSEHASMVYSLEPEPTLFSNAAAAFKGNDNVEIINDISERAFPYLLPKIHGDVNFWLDGHYSAGATHRGPNDTPIVAELEAISSNLRRWPRIVILIDDIRLFTGKVHVYGAYPTLDFLVDWSRANGLSWHIEHDIFIARKP